MKTTAIAVAVAAVCVLVLGTMGWGFARERAGYKKAIQERDIAISRYVAQQAEGVLRVKELENLLRINNAKLGKALADFQERGVCHPVHPDLRRIIGD